MLHSRISHFLITPFSFALLALTAEYSGLDLWLEHFFYNPVTHSWPYKSLFITSAIPHTGGKDFILLLALCNLLLIAASYCHSALRPYRKHLVFIFLGAVTGPVLVALIKNTSHIYTPWALSVFGGDMPYIRVFDHVPGGAVVGHAFPGGHSSGGFAYIGLYFALSAMRSKYRYYGLALPVLLGIGFAFTQEIRGAHFLSHDLFSFVICWMSALVLSVFFYRSERVSDDKTQDKQVYN